MATLKRGDEEKRASEAMKEGGDSGGGEAGVWMVPTRNAMGHGSGGVLYDGVRT